MPFTSESELILNPDGSIYHLHLLPEEIAGTVILVGDIGRVGQISKHFDKIEVVRQNREFLTHTGTYRGKRISALSTGIGIGNIDIVVNELDALVNFDLASRTPKKELVSLDLIRLGTSGGLQADVYPDTFVASTCGLGLDGLFYFYRGSEMLIDRGMTDAFIEFSGWSPDLPKPYIVKASHQLLESIGKGMVQGITATAPGFYGPQGRTLRAMPAFPEINELLTRFAINNERIINYEMETAALYGLGRMLGHNVLTVCTIVANRVNETFSKDYRAAVDQLIMTVLERLS